MNVVKVYAGMGNQFFQYAFGRVLQERQKAVAYDLSWYNTSHTNHPQFPRPLRLQYFQITNLNTSDFLKENPIVYDNRIKYCPAVFNLKNENNFFGYWQYHNYYKPYLHIFRQEYQLLTEYYDDPFMKWVDLIINTTSISMHVRRGDYQLHRKGMFRDLKPAYYYDALSRVEGDVFIFSDDLPWCKEIFKKEYLSRKIHFVDVVDYQAFELMKLCKHNIITNSTFSWWAAFLNDNPGKIVICPNHFLDCTAEHSEELRYPKEWIKINDYATF